MHNLNLQTKKGVMGTCEFKKKKENVQYQKKGFYAPMRWFFFSLDKTIFHKNFDGI